MLLHNRQQLLVMCKISIININIMIFCIFLKQYKWTTHTHELKLEEEKTFYKLQKLKSEDFVYMTSTNNTDQFLQNLIVHRISWWFYYPLLNTILPNDAAIKGNVLLLITWCDGGSITLTSVLYINLLYKRIALQLSSWWSSYSR